MSVTKIICAIVMTLYIQFSQLACASGNGIVVFQSDFGLSDQAGGEWRIEIVLK